MFTLTSPSSRALPMDSLPKLRHPSPFPTPLSSSLSFRSLPPPHFPSSSFRLPSIRASSSPSQNDPAFRTPRNTPSLPPLLQTLTSFLSPLLETTCIVIAAAAFFFMRFHHTPAVIAAPLTSPAAETDTAFTQEEAERLLEERLSTNPRDTEALHALMEVKIKARKMDEAFEVLNRLIELEPEEQEWPLLKANMHIYNDDHASARKLFEEILKKDPLRVEAFHGLVMATAQSNEPLKSLLKRVEEAIEVCKKQKKDSDVRDFRLLIAQIKVMEGDYTEALKAYQELVKEEPRDFRPYLCQGIIYTLLRKKDEADKQFNKFRRLVPKDHPYKDYFEDNMFATKFFSQKLEREGAGARG
ncbi:protein SLOW GREEN 1, chloroplastic [Glycine soja]|uniref:Protein SLOW GREEN 1, chloroplastic n=1 Tax=Glycine soja TaxID=3848 RepID=A0A445LD16_GLYSO|nr:protein SLOW GREEN 1, chloroplastic-like [Glycine soja]KAH1258540.1 protein SLOW GREEN 1, chloroplastic [Glycine max]RZC21163.1 protein SLOW GREEN 1, chloroplastic [Glycine soja]